MKPFLKWAGGKQWFVSQYPNLLYQDAKRYIEPFLGGGSVFFHMQPRKAILSDLNSDLIETYCALRDEPQKVWNYLIKHQKLHDKDYYYFMRAQRPRTSASRAARFIYLNRTCFNGIYRVNLFGSFNVPKGTKSSVIFPDDDFSDISHVLRKAKLLAQDFEDSIADAREGDFVYVDPPYTVRHNNNNFRRYNENIFSWADQERLAKSLSQAAQRGACILISNANHACIRKLYSESKWVHYKLSRRSQLASDSACRTKTSELFISNYLDEEGKQVDPRSGKMSVRLMAMHKKMRV